MTDKLTSALLLILLTVTVSAQTTVISDEFTTIDDAEYSVNDDEHVILEENSHEILKTRDCHNHSEHEGHSHMESDQDLVIMDSVMQSDEGTDFNCSGGFCMDHTHFHKKGLTLKRQLFDYFLKISC